MTVIYLKYSSIASNLFASCQINKKKTNAFRFAGHIDNQSEIKHHVQMKYVCIL